MFNASPYSALSFTFDGLKPFEAVEQNDQKFLAKANSEFFWGGSTRLRVNHLDPEANTSFEVQAIFPSPGRFNMNRFKFSVSAMGALAGKRYQLYPTTQHHIVIKPVASRTSLGESRGEEEIL